MSEIWKDIYFIENGVEFDYRGLYQVSSYGRVKSFWRNKEKILKALRDEKRYESVVLFNNSKKTFKVHRLVAHMFIDGYFDGAEVDHIDTNPSNNHVNNLRWRTHKENCNNELTKKHYSEANKGENNPMYDVHRYGEKNPMYGKNHSEETRAKQSEAMKEVWKNKSDEELTERSRKISEANKGKKNPMYGKNPLAGKSDEELAEISKKKSETWNNKSDGELAEISRKHSKAHKGEKNGRAVLVDRFTLDGQYLDSKYPFQYVEEMGFSKTGISNCCTGRIKSHKGFIFKYHKE